MQVRLHPGYKLYKMLKGNWVRAPVGDLMGMYTPGREPVSADRSLDGLSTSMFNPGGTKRVLSFGGLGNVPNTRLIRTRRLMSSFPVDGRR